MTLNMTNYEDSLGQYSLQQPQHPNISNNKATSRQTDSLKQHTKFSSFGSGVEACGSSVLPPASAMINTVEDMTGTFSSQFAHEIIKSMDDGNLFNFEENLVCNFDIDQLDDATSDVSCWAGLMIF